MQSSFWLELCELLLRILSALFGAESAEQPVRFEQIATQEIGTVVSACTQGAFGLSRGEGALDLACLAADGGVQVIATDGSGELRTSSTGLSFEWDYQVPPLPPRPVAADVNGDGRLDLVAFAYPAGPSTAPCRLAVLLGDGQGGFAPGPSRPIAHACRGLGSGDFDEDGTLDFVVPYAVQDTLAAVGATVFLTRPGGQFEVTNYHEQAATAVEEYRQRGVSDALVFDADGDGHADVVFVATLTEGPWEQPGHGWLHVLRGDGRGGLGPGPARDIGMPGDAFSVTAGDYDEDGHTDVALAVIRTYYRQDQLELPVVMFGRSAGEFSEPVDVPPTEASAALLSADYNRDGHIDLVTASIGGPIHVYAGRGDGSWAAPFGLSVGPVPHFITLLDFELDGRLDLVAVTGTAVDRLPLPLAAAALGAPRVTSLVTQYFDWEGMRIIDIDGDSDNDVVFGHGQGVAYFENRGKVSLRLHDFQLFADNEWMQFADLGDLNGDGRIDTLHIRPPDLRVHLQRAEGSWEPLAPIATAFPEPGNRLLALADANGDGRLDIIESLYAYPVTRVAVHQQDVQGAFSTLPPMSFEGTLQQMHDADGDGCVDLYVSIKPAVGIMTGDCEGGFTRGQFIAPPPRASSRFELADMNLDGRLDFIFSTGIMLANASGGYEQAATFTSDQFSHVQIDELNGDGLPDIVSFSENLVVVYQGNGDGSLKAPQQVPGALNGVGWPALRVVGDLVGDALPDVVVMNPYGAATEQVPRPSVESPGLLVELTVIENISARAALWDALAQLAQVSGSSLDRP